MNLFSGGLGFIALGIFFLYRGRNIIRTRHMFNTYRAYLFTGEKEIRGEKAVFAGKFAIVMGWIVISIGSLMLLLRVGSAMRDFGRGSFSFDSSSIAIGSKLDPNRNAPITGHSPSNENGFTESSEFKPSRAGQNPIIPTPPLPDSKLKHSIPEDRQKHPSDSPTFQTADNDPDRPLGAHGSKSADKPRGTATDDNDDPFANFEMNLPDNIPADLRAKVENNLKIGKSMRDRLVADQSTDDDNGNNKRAKSPVGSPDNVNSNDAVEADAGESKIGSPTQALPKLSFRVEKTIKSKLFGFRLADTETADSLETDRVVVGFVVTQGKTLNGSIKAIAPIYQQENQYTLGKTLGDPVDGTNEVALIAPAGHIVCGMKIQSGVRILSLQLAYCPVDQQGKLDLKQIQVSKDVGIPGGKSETIFEPGEPIVGVYGALHRGELAAIGLIAADRLVAE